MNLNRKPRSNSILDDDSKISPEKRAELRDMMLSGASHAECKAWLLSSCSVVVKSGDTLTTFYKRHCAPVVNEGRKFAVVKSETYGDSIKTKPVDWVARILERVKQLAFELMIESNPDAGKVKELVDALVKLDKQSLDREKFNEALRKAKEAEAVTSDGALTEGQKAARMKEIFGF